MHWAGASKGLGPVSTSPQVPCGLPAATQASKVAMSAAATGDPGLGGMGEVLDFIRVTETSAMVFDGSLLAGAVRSV